MTSRIATQPQQPVSKIAPRKMVEGFRAPDRSPPTENEIDSLSFIRIITADTNPPVTLRAVKALRKALLAT